MERRLLSSMSELVYYRNLAAAIYRHPQRYMPVPRSHNPKEDGGPWPRFALGLSSRRVGLAWFVNTFYGIDGPLGGISTAGMQQAAADREQFYSVAQAWVADETYHSSAQRPMLWLSSGHTSCRRFLTRLHGAAAAR